MRELSSELNMWKLHSASKSLMKSPYSQILLEKVRPQVKSLELKFGARIPVQGLMVQFRSVVDLVDLVKVVAATPKL